MKIKHLSVITILIVMIMQLSCSEESDDPVNSNNSDVVEVDKTLPVINITSPKNNEEIAKGDDIEITASVTDDSGINFVRIYINNNEVSYIETAPYSYTWSTLENELGIYEIKVEAFDKNDNESTSIITINLVEPTCSLKINGILKDRYTNNVLTDINIDFESSSTKTNINGEFEINSDIISGNYSITIAGTDSYIPAIYSFDIENNISDNIEMYMYPKQIPVNNQGLDFIKGISLFDAGPWMGQELYPEAFNSTFKRLKTINANLITVFDPVFVIVVGDDSVKMSSTANTSNEWNMLNETQYSTLTSNAKQEGHDFMYWFGVWPQEENQLNGKSFNQTVFSGEVLSDAFWNDWFSEYEKYLIQYARVAETNNVPYISLGHGLNYATSPIQFSSEDLYHNLWTDLINNVRAVYSGDIIYFGNARPFDALNYAGYTEIEYYEDEYYTSTFKSLFDAFGIIISNITKQTNPTVSDIKSSVNEILNRYSTFEKPIILWVWASSVDGAAGRYGHLEPILDVNTCANNFEVDFYEQADIYEGIMQAVNETSVNVKGIISHGYMYYDMFKKYEPRDMNTAFDKAASIRCKPSENVLQYWFGGM